MQTKQSLKVQYVAVSDLKSAVYNPRFWSDEATTKLTESIKTFGLVDPILCNSAPKRKNVVIGGHFRLKIAKDLDYKTVPVVYINLPNIEKEKELNLRLNRNTGDWDYELLKDFDPTLLLDIGFDETDLSHIFDDSLEIEDDEFNVEKELAKIKKTDIKLGDRFALGNHRLACIDSTDQNAVKAFMDKAKADLINTDLPYNIGLNYDGGLGGKKNYGGQINDSKTDDEYRRFVEQVITNALSVAKPDCHITPNTKINPILLFNGPNTGIITFIT